MKFEAKIIALILAIATVVVGIPAYQKLQSVDEISKQLVLTTNKVSQLNSEIVNLQNQGSIFNHEIEMLGANNGWQGDGTIDVLGSPTSTISYGLEVALLGEGFAVGGESTSTISGISTSTFAKGIDIGDGCFALNGTCISAGSGANTALSNLTGVAINTALLSDANNTDDLGAYDLAWKDVYSSGTAYLDTLSVQQTATIVGALTAGATALNGDLSFNIGGISTTTLDGVVIGGNTPAAGTFTALTFTGAGVLGDGGDDIAIDSDDWDISSAGTATNLSISTSTIDNIVVGGSTPAAGSFTTLTTTGLTTLGNNSAGVVIDSDTWDVSTAGEATGLSLSTSTIDNIVIGGSTAVAGTFTTLTANTELIIPNDADPTVATTGEIDINTTTASSSIRFNDGAEEKALYPFASAGLPYASSTLSYMGSYGAAGTTTIRMMNSYHPMKLIGIYCKTDVGSAHITFNDGTNHTEGVICDATGAQDDGSMVNNTWDQFEDILIDIGTQTSDPNVITVSPIFEKQAD